MFAADPRKTADPRPAPRRRRTLRVLALAALPAVLMHGLVLGGLPAAGSGPGAAANLPPLRVRAIVGQPVDQRAPPADPDRLPIDADPPRPAETSLREPTVAAGRPDAGGTAEVDAAAEAGPAVPLPSAAAADPTTTATSEQPIELPPADEELPQLLAAADTGMQLAADRGTAREGYDGDPAPIYPTSFPPSQTLRYDLQRGLLSGTGELSWRRDPPDRADAGYELQLLAKLGGLTILTQVSKGGFDKAGLAPQRFTDQRLRGSVRAANFQRQRGLITFSGPSVEYPLVRGVQDRLSWMIQVPAILAANPRLAAPGQRITMAVVGARGDATTWEFRFDERERITTEGGEVMTVKFSRQPRKQHDTLAEVWLDPARHYLPLRARIGNPEEGAMLELRRID